MAASEESLALLRSIDATMKELLALSKQRLSRPGANGGGYGPDVASEAECRSKYGDPTVKAKDPRDWTGPTMKGRKFSQCPAPYLDLLADRHDYFAGQAAAENKLTDKGKPVADFERTAARRARGWAALIRAGKHTPPPSAEDDTPGWADEGF